MHTKYGDLLDGVDAEKSGVNPQTLERVILLATEIAREGREGRKLGAMFVIGDAEEVLRRSRCLILDPLWHHPEERKRIDNANMRETVKELAQLDGAFVVSNKGVVVSACRYIDVLSEGIDLPLGLGSRHMAAASITQETEAMAVVVSESSTVRVFDDGEIVSEIIPEVWLLRNYGVQLVNQARRTKTAEEDGDEHGRGQLEMEI
jgi:DNA integrity scanning protein DisA with diadenylate cyclase activity